MFTEMETFRSSPPKFTVDQSLVDSDSEVDSEADSEVDSDSVLLWEEELPPPQEASIAAAIARTRRRDTSFFIGVPFLDFFPLL